MIVDAHQHFWRYDPREYAWIDERMRVLERDFLPGDLEPLIRRQGIDRTIAVQACQTTSETEWLLELAAAHPFIAGVIGWVDLQADDVEARVERAARNRKLVGVRHVVQSEPDDGFLLRPAFGRGIATLARHGLVYDLLIYPRHLPIASDFVGRFDSQTFVLDHLAKPDIRSRAIDDWARDLRRLAQHPQRLVQGVRAHHRGGLGTLDGQGSRAVSRRRVRLFRPCTAHRRVRLAGLYARGRLLAYDDGVARLPGAPHARRAGRGARQGTRSRCGSGAFALSTRGFRLQAEGCVRRSIDSRQPQPSG